MVECVHNGCEHEGVLPGGLKVPRRAKALHEKLLAEDGKLKLTDPVRKWLPTLPKATEPITIRHLLTHTSGLIDYEDVIPDSFKAQLHDADVLTLLESQDRLYFHPGGDYRYSNSGYALLALIVERASGLTFATFLRER